MMKGTYMDKKYRLTSECITIPSLGEDDLHMYRIEALRDFGDVKKGDLGGYVESEKNLSHNGTCWIYDEASVSGNAQVYGNVIVYGKAFVTDRAKIFDNAKVGDCVSIYDNVVVYGDAEIHGGARLTGKARLGYHAYVEETEDCFSIGPIGSSHGHTTFYNTREGIYVNCGCFNSPIDDFEKQVAENNKGTEYETEYNLAIELAKKKIKQRAPKKYEITDERTVINGYIVCRIRALRDIGNVKKGQLGGWIESEKNLSQEGQSWIYNDAIVLDHARVYEDAKVFHNALVSDHAEVYGSAMVCNNATVTGSSRVYGFTKVSENAKLEGKTDVSGTSLVTDYALVRDSFVYESACVEEHAQLSGGASIHGSAVIKGNARIQGQCNIERPFKYFVAGPFYPHEGFITFYTIQDVLYMAFDEYVGRVSEFLEHAYGEDRRNCVDFVSYVFKQYEKCYMN